MTNSIESIDLKIMELQEQKRRLQEEQQSKAKEFYNVDEILTAANQRMHKVLTDAGIAESDVLSLSSNQIGLQEEHKMIAINVKTSSGKKILSRLFSVAYINRVIDEIVDHAIALEEISRRFYFNLSDSDDVSRNAVHLKTINERLNVRLSLAGDDRFDVRVSEHLEVAQDGFSIHYGEDSDAYICIQGLDLNASFIYERDEVSVSEIADILETIDSEYSKLSFGYY